jgi:hypothetical protein
MAKMTTPATKKSEALGLERKQKKQGGIIPSKLQHHDRVIIETEAFVYEVTVNTITYPTTRYMIHTACNMCRECGEHITGITSHDKKLKANIPDWIGKGVCLLMLFDTGSNFLTGRVIGVTLVRKRADGSELNYDMWRD